MDALPHEKQIEEYQITIEKLKNQNKKDALFNSEIENLEKKLSSLKEKVYGDLSSWERVQICRHPKRPRTIDYIEALCDPFIELYGDRTYRDDPSIIGGLAYIGEMKCVIIGQEKGNDTESRLHRNFGMMSPEGFRKALRLLKLAEKFQLPVVSLIDTPGAYAVLEAEERGQAWAIAENLKQMASLATPIIVLVIGEGCSGGALGMAVGDVVAMLEHSYYSVISPESCASILWKDTSKKNVAADALKLNSEILLGLEVIDTIIREPLGGAHHDTETVFEDVKTFLLEQWERLKVIPPQKLLELRYEKLRQLGKYEKVDNETSS